MAEQQCIASYTSIHNKKFTISGHKVGMSYNESYRLPYEWVNYIL